MRLTLFLLTFCFSFNWLNAQKKDTVTVIGVGDIMMGSNYPNSSGLPPNNGSDLLTDVKLILQSADVTMGNLEGVLLNDGGTAKTCRDPKVCYVFRSPQIYVQNLVDAGFDLMSLANNHAGDFGETGRKSSMKTLEEAGIAHAGQLTTPYAIIEKGGIRYGFVAFAPNNNCLPLNDFTGAKKIVSKLDSLADIVIVSFHGGAEGPQYQHVPREEEIFHGENRGDVYKFSHILIDAGADIIFGHGPHVTRAIEVYKERLIAYSLGNFCTYSGINVSGVNGLAPILKVYTNNQGVFYKAQIFSTKQTYRDRVRLDSQKQVLSRIRELTQQDFPESQLSIDENGWVTKSKR